MAISLQWSVMELDHAKHSDLGSGLVADFALAQLQHLLSPEANLDEFDEAGWSAFVYELVNAIQGKLSEFADEENINYKDLSCTIIAIVAAADRLLTFHVGDEEVATNSGMDLGAPS